MLITASIGRVIVDGIEIYGWVEKPNGLRQNLFGFLIDLLPDNYIPKQAQSAFKQSPSPKVKKVEDEAVTARQQFHPINYSEGIKVYKTTNFTGENRYVDEDWSFGDIAHDDDFFDW